MEINKKCSLYLFFSSYLRTKQAAMIVYFRILKKIFIFNEAKHK